MKILITGGAGFIASHIVDAYLEDGHEVVVLDDLSTGREERINKLASFYKCDIRSADAVKIVKKESPDILSHHAAQVDVRVSLDQPLVDLLVNLMGLVNILEACRSVKLKKVIFASSGGAIYGEQTAYPATEEHPTLPLNPYGLNKLMSERYLDFYYRQYGIPYTALRYSNVYGPRQLTSGEAGVVAVFTQKMLRGEQPFVYGDGQQTRDFVFVKDVVEANRAALNQRICGSYNISTGVETDMNTLFSSVRVATGAKYSVAYKPARSGEQLRSVLSNQLFVRKTGWSPKVDLDEGLGHTVKWFLNEKA